MISFLSSAWLWALAALVIPIAIHLLNRRQGKRIQISSLRFLESSQSKRIRHLKLTDFPLLVLRALMFGLLAILLAKPALLRQDSAGTDTPQDWVLVSGEIKSAAANRAIDSLLTNGAELRLLAPNFPLIGRSEPLENLTIPQNIWSLLRSADKKAPSGSAFHIFAPRKLAFFNGSRPEISRKVYWHFLPIQTEKQWIQSARIVSQDSLLVEIGVSDSVNVWLAKRKFSLPREEAVLRAKSLPPILFTPKQADVSATVEFVQENTPLVSEKTELTPQAPKINAVIFHDDERREDAAYVRAALEVAASQNEIYCELTTLLVTEIPEDLPRDGIIFWLSKQDFPENLGEDGPPLLSVVDAGGARYESLDGEIVLQNLTTVGAPGIRRRTALRLSEAITVWNDPSGEPLLTRTILKSGIRYDFASRFHPTWTDLPLDPVFPQWIESLLLEFANLTFELDPVHDLRTVDARQVQPILIERRPGARAASALQALQTPLWILLAIIFMLERVVSIWKTE